MKIHLTVASTLALSVALAGPVLAADQDRGNGNGNGNGRGQQARAERTQDLPGNGNRETPGRGNGKARGDDRGAPQGRGNGNAATPSDRADNRGNGRDRGSGLRPETRNGAGAVDRNDRRTPVVVGRDDRSEPVLSLFRGDRYDSRTVMQGCPPGLAKKNNGCLPPGQARQMRRDASGRYDGYWLRGDDRYRYDDGYMYRYDRNGGLSGWLPALGGALGLGNVWPQQYSYQPAPQYYSQYYGLNDRYNYRYADGVLYGVDPQTQAIQQVAALLTGQPWTVGQAMPQGYDVYNVPYDYRGQYPDSPQSWYRYSDGYVYQVDPTTRLVQAVIQLLA
jgi:hypothetical protein